MYVKRIVTQTEYEQALELMGDLIEDYDKNLPLIEVLSA